MDDGSINISDVIEVIQTDPGFSEVNQKLRQEAMEMSMERAHRPYVEIVEQPAGKALRFRYECEGRSAGSIPGVNSTPENRTYPSIKVVGYKGRAVAVVSCVTKDPPYRPHPHNLVGKEACKQGVCTLEFNSDNMICTFANLGIQCVKKKDIEDALKAREEMRVDPYRTGFEHKKQSNSIDLNALRLCFQVFVEGNQKGKFNVPLTPVVSNPIFDKKAMSDLVICKLSHCCASVAGGTEMILLCEKVAKEDIQVKFFEEQDGQVLWEGYGDFQPTHVHKQTAIAFRTPSYHQQQVEQPVQVFIQLRRPSDGTTSEALPFQMLPLGSGRPAFWSLRKAFARKKTDYNAFNKILATESALFSNSNSRPSRNIDDFNNNDFDVRRSNNKMSTLRALNDLYNVRKSLDLGNDSMFTKGRLQSMDPSMNNANLDHQNNEIVEISRNELKIGDNGEARNGEFANNANEVFHNNPSEFTNDCSEKAYIGVFTSTNKLDNDDQLNGGAKTLVRNDDVECIARSLEESKNRTDWFDYSEIGKWVQKGQECLKEKSDEVEPKNEDLDDGGKSLNELLSQVAELDQIYADTHTKLLQTVLEPNANGLPMDVDACDNRTYTSLQMAMKNPIELLDVPVDDRKYEDVCVPDDREERNVPVIPPPLPAKREVMALDLEERLPPLPPKRIRKMPSMPILPRPNSSNVQAETYSVAPNKNLPSLPGTLPKFSKQNLFSKLFAKKSKKDKIHIQTIHGDSNFSLNSGDSTPSFMKQDSLEISPSQLARPSMASVTSVKSFSLEDDENPNYGLDLTEAEHYALYTSMAPRATASEFDEMSFYYSPVEGGKILMEGKQ
ncbi:embryonic polarity protein dorsal-like isoform X1 [Prorops nasuta]|uniref:embryonic polarity protein dorsal-like isoform X1 n=1 Tax=Prorops nasuta TaxID=863751 RepID=UPI0034CE01CE